MTVSPIFLHVVDGILSPSDYSQCVPGAAASSNVATTSNSSPTTLSTATKTSSTTTKTTGGASQATSVPVATNSGNPIAGKTFYANPFYSSEIVSIAAPSLVAAGSSALAAKATQVANIGTFYWL